MNFQGVTATSEVKADKIPSAPTLRAGAALILALVILTMLLALALPFVFTQGAASNGARAWHQHTAAKAAAPTAPVT